MIEDILLFRDLLQIYHWTTTSYEQHVATGKLYDDLVPLIDEFVEVYQMEERLKFNRTIKLKNLNESEFKIVIKKVSKWLASREFEQNICNNRSELLNIRDEMLSLINKTIYLLSLK